MKGYLSVRETSYKWNISERWVSRLAQDGRIPGVESFGRSWAIPENAEKPAVRGRQSRRSVISGRRIDAAISHNNEPG